MFKMKTVREQALDLRRENIRLRTELEKTNADVDYIAMMSDIELDNSENDETEEYDDEQQI